MTSTALPGEWVEHAPGLEDLAGGSFRSQVSTDRYRSREYAERERAAIWMKTWQIAGRVDDLPKVGDWMEYKLYDQSFLIVRGGKDEQLRGFVNACRHRGNALCKGRAGNAKRGFLCQYHLWSYDLDGRLKGLLREENAGGLDKSDNSLIAVPVDTFGGFVFINPDADAQPLAEWIGEEAMATLAPYHLELMSTVMNVREALDCNWKVVMDAFNEATTSTVSTHNCWQCSTFSRRPRATSSSRTTPSRCPPFEVVGATPPEKQVEGTLSLPETFPGTVAVIPRFQELVKEYTADDGSIDFPDGVTARTLLQKATRAHLTEMGLDVSGLTDAQMSDNHGWFLFPNFMMTIRAGECHVILARPHPDGGDPNRCIWHVASYMYLPPEMADAFTVDLTEVDEPGSYKYFEALQQDYEQMQRQQSGLRNENLDHLMLVNEEIVVAKISRHHGPMDGRKGSTVNLEDRIALHNRMARAYGDAYLRQGVQDGEKKFVDVWKFHPDCMYASPYFTGDEAFKLSEFPRRVRPCVDHGAKVYSLRFPDWKPVDFKHWPADNGFVMKNPLAGHQQGHRHRNGFLLIQFHRHRRQRGGGRTLGNPRQQ